MLGPAWIPLESVSGTINRDERQGKVALAFDGRQVWILTKASRKVQILDKTGLLLSPKPMQ